MKKVTLILAIIFSQLIIAQADKKDKKQYFVTVDTNVGYLINNEFSAGNFKPLIWTGGFRIQKRLNHKSNLTLGLRGSDLIALLDKSDDFNRPFSFEIPISYEINIIERLDRSNKSKTNNQLKDSGIFLELGGYYSFSNQIRSSNILINKIDKGTNIGATARVSYSVKGLFDMYIEARRDLTKFRPDFDQNYSRFIISFGYNIYLFSFN